MLATNIVYQVQSIPQLKNPDYQNELIHFLFTHLGQYSDPLADIRSCLQYILDEKHGGHVITAQDQHNEIQGVVFLAKTNMKTFVPDYLLVYIAVNNSLRGQGIGQGLLEFIKGHIDAPIALHVEHDNPAKRLYEKMGFTNKYTEMRWHP